MGLVSKPRVSKNRAWQGAWHLLRLRVALALLAVLALTTAGELVGFVEPASAQTPPYIATPAAGATVSGTVTLDVVEPAGATGVEFVIIGTSCYFCETLPATQTLYGWDATWNTTTVANGSQYIASRDNEGDDVVETVTVDNAPPVVTTQPQNQTGASGGSVTFSAAASGSPAPSVTWQYLALGATTWTTGIASTTTSTTGSTTTSTYTISGLNGYATGTEIRALFTNASGSALTNPATLSITPPGFPISVFLAPQITTQPQNQTVAPGGSVTFTAGASGVPTPTVIWQFSFNQGTSWTTLTDATTIPLTASNVSAYANGIEVEAVFTNPLGTATTNPATLTVTPGA